MPLSRYIDSTSLDRLYEAFSAGTTTSTEAFAPHIIRHIDNMPRKISEARAKSLISRSLRLLLETGIGYDIRTDNKLGASYNALVLRYDSPNNSRYKSRLSPQLEAAIAYGLTILIYKDTRDNELSASTVNANYVKDISTHLRSLLLNAGSILEGLGEADRIRFHQAFPEINFNVNSYNLLGNYCSRCGYAGLGDEVIHTQTLGACIVCDICAKWCTAKCQCGETVLDTGGQTCANGRCGAQICESPNCGHTCDCCEYIYCGNCIAQYENIRHCVPCGDSALGFVKFFDKKSKYAHSGKPLVFFKKSDKPNPVMIKGAETDDRLYMGLEIEVEHPTMDDRQIIDLCEPFLKGRAIFKNDGSLSHGSEIVLCPHDYESLRKINFKKLLDSLLKAGCHCGMPLTCGLHIHVNRSYYAGTDIIKIADLMSNSVDKFVALSRRTKDNLLRWGKIPPIPEYSWETKHRNKVRAQLVAKVGKEKRHTGYGKGGSELLRNWANEKYKAINMLHKETFEFRLFGGTLDYTNFMASVQTVLALTEYAKKTPYLKAIEFGNFRKFVTDHKHAEYKILDKYLTQRSI